MPALPADLAAAIAAARPDLAGFDRVEYHAEVESTNDLALTLAANSAPQGTVVIADAQTAGRGRLGRVWHSPPEAGLYLSAILRPASWSRTLSLVTMAAGIAVVRALKSSTGLEAELKWPNDVVIGRPWRKLAGILSETVSTSARVDAVIVGIGVNLRAGSFPPELAERATAVELELGRAVDRAGFIVALLAQLAEIARRLAAGDGSWVAPDWRHYGRAGLGGAPVRWHDGHRSRRGHASDIDESGALIIDAEDTGVRERVISGEVLWDRLSRE